ncbi:MAG: hypothetical protein JST25_02335 [Actinobacteria bacterium]|nr:hypothetical protein [Actinomycetota bacterium]
MNLSALSNVLLILLVVGVIAVRQMTWRPVRGSRDWLLPGLAAVIGLALLLPSLDGRALGPIDLVAFVIELAIAIALGVWMGVIAHIRPLESRAGRAPEPAGRPLRAAQAVAAFETRTGAWGLALWLVLIGVRVALTFVFESLGSHLGVSTGLILVMLAANRAVRIVVLHHRVLRQPQQREGHGGSGRSGSRRIMVS